MLGSSRHQGKIKACHYPLLFLSLSISCLLCPPPSSPVTSPRFFQFLYLPEAPPLRKHKLHTGSCQFQTKNPVQAFHFSLYLEQEVSQSHEQTAAPSTTQRYKWLFSAHRMVLHFQGSVKAYSTTLLVFGSFVKYLSSTSILDGLV